MKRKSHHVFIAMFLFSLTAWSQGTAPSKENAWKDVDAAMGRAGQDQPDGTHKYSLPRKDMNVTVNGVQIKAGLALGSWVAFKSTSQENSMVMGDLVLAEDEVAPVMGSCNPAGLRLPRCTII